MSTIVIGFKGSVLIVNHTISMSGLLICLCFNEKVSHSNLSLR